MKNLNVMLAAANQRGTFHMPTEILYDKKADERCLLIYTALVSYIDPDTAECRVPVRTLCDLLGLHYKTTRIHLRHLEEHGFIGVLHQGQGRTNRYFILK